MPSTTEPGLQRKRLFPTGILQQGAALFRRRSVQEIRQMDSTECGAACLTMILNYYGRRTRLAEVREHCGVGRDGLSALTIVRGARDFGLRVRALSLQSSNLQDLPLPAIVHWRFSHFIVVERWSPKGVDVVDPARGRVRLSHEEFDEGFTGVAILLEPGVQFSRTGITSRITLRSYVMQMLQAPGILIQLLVASLMLQILGLIVPLFTQLVVDQILPAHMQQVILLVGLGICIFVLTQMVTTLLRSTLLVYLQARVDTQMMLNFFEHLLSLPYRFFQQRLSGDLLARISSNIAIRDLFTNQLIASALDGSFIITYLVLLFCLSWLYGCLALGMGIIQITLLLVSNRPVRRLASRELETQGRSQGYMNEVLSGIATIKAAGAEPRALSNWSNHFFEQLNVSIRRQYLTSLIETALSALRTLTPLATLWIGLQLVLTNHLTLGTMLALNSLVASFLTPLSSLVDSGQRLQQVRAHFERIADVIEENPEQALEQANQPPALSGRIELSNVSFRYHAQGELVLRNIHLHIEPGQKVALVGHTGSGKSTLGKLLLALYQPTAGEILYDGIPLSTLNYREVRSQFGVVLQDASIFSGSLRHNISFNDPNMDMEQVAWATQMAALHDDIQQMPMHYETFVSEAGSALSGGQRQRLAIARALAARPRVILFDEATSHLDVLTESIVEQNLRTLTCTRIVIAHRLSTIRDADLILVLDKGEIVEQGTHETLLQQDGFYARLIEQQMENAREGQGGSISEPRLQKIEHEDGPMTPTPLRKHTSGELKKITLVPPRATNGTAHGPT